MMNNAKDYKSVINQTYIDKAKSLEPNLIHELRKPLSIIEMNKEYKVILEESIEELYFKELGKDDTVILDFKNHYVGYFSFNIKAVGSPFDAPCFIRFRFVEKLFELEKEVNEIESLLSTSWVQEDYLHIDVLPDVIKLNRRYAFRYVEIKIINTSPKYKVVIENPLLDTVTSGMRSNVEDLLITQDKLRRLDEVAIKTLQDCMQSVFEDGPKRDQRLWLGDLRLQALSNYYTFKNNDLVKRCLYLFAGATLNDGRIGACLFLKPEIRVDDTYLFDYSLFFISCLYDYYEATKDLDTLKELSKIAFKQIDFASEFLDENFLVKDSEEWYSFIDWTPNLNKQASSQAIFIYTLKQAIEIADSLGLSIRKEECEKLLNKLLHGSNQLWDEKSGFFISGNERQVSYASQIWFVLAGVIEGNQAKELLIRLFNNQEALNLSTPYMYHHLIEALLKCNLKKTALRFLYDYWGKMVEDGADCFYELFNIDGSIPTPYGDKIINSYCHAWSCTPTYFIRKYFNM